MFGFSQRNCYISKGQKHPHVWVRHERCGHKKKRPPIMEGRQHQ